MVGEGELGAEPVGRGLGGRGWPLGERQPHFLFWTIAQDGVRLPHPGPATEIPTTLKILQRGLQGALSRSAL